MVKALVQLFAYTCMCCLSEGGGGGIVSDIVISYEFQLKSAGEPLNIVHRRRLI